MDQPQQSLWSGLYSVIEIVGFVALVEILLGRRGRRRMQAALENLWYKFDEMKFQMAGKTEATSCLRFFDRIYSDKFFSPKRLVSSFLTSIILISLYYILVESYRMSMGLYFRPPFSAGHFHNDGQAIICSIFFRLHLTDCG